MIKRNITEKILKGLSFSPVVLLIGARQTGKSTLISALAKELQYSYFTFDSLATLASAKNNPIGFINEIPKPVVLDEVQRIPEIFLPIKHDVDQNREPGRYALTGSANPLLVPHLGDTLAGRMIIFELYPLSQGELLGIKDDFIDIVFNHKKPQFTVISKQKLIEKILLGGYPNVQNLENDQRELWFDNYISTMLTREITELAKIEGLTELPRLLYLLAGRSGGLLNVSDISRDSNLPNTTLHRYLALLQAIFMIYTLPPWSVGLKNRVVRSPKIFMIDTGLMAHLLEIDSDRLRVDQVLTGNLFENFVLNELKKQATWSDKKVSFYHYRTHQGVEVDIILEDRAGKIVGIEIKSSETIIADDFKGLKHLQKMYPKRFVKGILLYTGSELLPFDKEIQAWPLSALWANSR